MKRKPTLAYKNNFTVTPNTPNISNTSSPGGSKNTELFDQHSSNKTEPSQETLQLSLMYLMSKFALTQEKSYAEAVYQHLHMLAVRCDTDSKPRFLYRSLAMDWVQMCRGQMSTKRTSRTGPH